ncbi:hypothetical protein H8958_012441 [Nasalis larvatus]
MKVSVAALAVILVTTALCAPASASPLPEGKEKQEVSKTDTFETFKGGICKPYSFVTRKNRQVCANPEKKWVREYINSLEMS